MGLENSWSNVRTTWVWKIAGQCTYYVGLENSWVNVNTTWVWKIAGLMYVLRGSGK